MTFVLRLGSTTRPGAHLPAFAGPGFARWEHRCGWCDEVFMTAAELIEHVVRERARCEK